MQETIEVLGRANLRDIRDAALREAQYDDINHIWQEAYTELADAADHLDAMLARSEVKPATQMGTVTLS